MSEASAGLEEFRHCDCRELPIGVYLVKPDGQFIDCNRVVREMLGLPLEGPVTHASLADFYAEPEKRQELLQKAAQLQEQGRFLSREPVRFRVGGKDLVVELYCREIRDPVTRQLQGYLGCLVDVTRDVQRVEELTFDIGRILHANTTTLVMMTQTLNSLIEFLGPNPFQDVSAPSAEDIDSVLSGACSQLDSVVGRFLEVADEERRGRALSQAAWKYLSDQRAILRDFKTVIQVPEFRPPTLRKIAHEIVTICQQVIPGNLPRELVRELQQAASNLERLCNLVDVLNTRMAVLQMDYTLHSLREFVTADTRQVEKREILTVKSLIEQTVARLAEYARSSGIEIQVGEIPDVQVRVNEREMVRALANLLHNAIKYTWKRDRTRSSWVSIRVGVHGGRVVIEFENWGVPIARDELEQGLIFNLGYRGKWSTDRGRLGTGIGLTDARRVAEAHQGSLYIDSHPARRSSIAEDDPEYYQQPFLTVVSISLPLV